MKIRYSRYVGIIIILIITIPCLAQDYKQEILKMHTTYSNLDQFSTEVEISVYASQGSDKPYITKHASIEKNGQKYFYTVDNMSMLYNQRCVLMINESEKSIFYSKTDKRDLERSMSNMAIPNMDSVIQLSDSVRFLGLDEAGNLQYGIYNASDYISQMQIKINEKTHLITELIYYYNIELYPINNKVIIRYTNINVAPSFALDFFSEKRFVSGSINNMKPVLKYSQYELIINDLNDEE